MRSVVTRLSSLAALSLLALGGCDSENHRYSSKSAGRSHERGAFIAEYVVPADADLGRYQVIESWVEVAQRSSERQIVARLKGPHVDQEPRVRIEGFDDSHYRGIWSKPNGPPYEVWAAPDPLPGVLVIEREGKRIELRKRIE
jgi:hypothetical protein